MVTIDLPKELDELIDLKQFKVGQIIEHTEVPQSWRIIDVREEWLKVQPSFKQYIGDKRKPRRFHRVLVDTAVREGWWRILEENTLLGGTTMARRISTLHYVCLNSDQTEMISVDQQTFPEVLIEQREGEEAFPKHCPACGSDELKFSRVEEYYDEPDADGLKELIKTYRIHHVVCVKCSEEGTLAHFQ